MLAGTAGNHSYDEVARSGEVADSPAWSELLYMPQPESPHLPQLELPDFQTMLEPTSTSLDNPAAGVLDQVMTRVDKRNKVPSMETETSLMLCPMLSKQHF